MTNQLELSELKRSWCDCASPIVEQYAATHGAFTMDDVRPLLPEPEHANWYGILLSIARRRGIIERVGYQASTRAERNGGVVCVWRKPV